ncbi:MAG: hypothetical protein DMF66_12075 [Acidobacteria bacterium]|nr:MAG: hypothetical protein DMF66_12075 [Acidobacteriota bacterium]
MATGTSATTRPSESNCSCTRAPDPSASEAAESVVCPSAALRMTRAVSRLPFGAASERARRSSVIFFRRGREGVRACAGVFADALSAPVRGVKRESATSAVSVRVLRLKSLLLLRGGSWSSRAGASDLKTGNKRRADARAPVNR